MSWSNAYIGLPHVALGRERTGCDCWGLVRLVYREQLGIALPAYTPEGICALEEGEIEALIGAATTDGAWEQVAEPAPFDVLIYRRGGYRSHIGLKVDARFMLHSPETGSVLADVTGPRWRSRFEGAWRYRGQT
ncbi:C40 family peptidase [Salipiger thiooxidans]|uniref:NlpC/P60 family protein n=1 Tax=Salipiger thiooxidans TaxID=282683 RepID=UPI001A9029B4|nr:C40 family peptidase [Salipiger thiooxidans]